MGFTALHGSDASWWRFLALWLYRVGGTGSAIAFHVKVTFVTACVIIVWIIWNFLGAIAMFDARPVGIFRVYKLRNCFKPRPMGCTVVAVGRFIDILAWLLADLHDV